MVIVPILRRRPMTSWNLKDVFCFSKYHSFSLLAVSPLHLRIFRPLAWSAGRNLSLAEFLLQFSTGALSIETRFRCCLLIDWLVPTEILKRSFRLFRNFLQLWHDPRIVDPEEIVLRFKVWAKHLKLLFPQEVSLLFHNLKTFFYCWDSRS